MPTIKNKRRTPLVVSLPGGKKLRLGPLKSAEISAKAAQHPRVVKLVDNGAVEVFGSAQKSGRSGGGGVGTRASSGRGPGGGGIQRQSGDR